MRDNSLGMAELVRAERDGDLYFGVLGLERAGERTLYRFRTSRAGYVALKRGLELRPFDKMPGVSRRFFFSGSYARLGDDESLTLQVRVEEGGRARSVDVDAPPDLISNLLWFSQLRSPAEAEHLRIAV